jgi:adenylyl- and sulfurtransferase ThiI
MDENMTAMILRVIELESKDDSVRRRAEETLAAMIADALDNGSAGEAD